MRSIEYFSVAWQNLVKMIEFHNRPYWLCAIGDEYVISLVEPSPKQLAHGTAANLYSTDLLVTKTVKNV